MGYPVWLRVDLADEFTCQGCTLSFPRSLARLRVGWCWTCSCAVGASERFVMVVDSGGRSRWLRAPTVFAAAGVIGLYLAAPALAEPTEITAPGSGNVAGTPCTATASACVDVDNKQAWLVKDGKIVRGPVPISTGGTGTDTPTGDSFRVFLKDKDHTSNEFKLPNGRPAPMPNAVFFEDGGIAFHAGSPQRASAGCVHLGVADSLAFFNFLNIGDQVQVMNGPIAASEGIPPAISNASAPTDDSNDPDAHSSAPETSDDDDFSHRRQPSR